ncbi:Chromatin-remodeling complex ATPase chain Iswi [Lachnellula suecica]|uniref:Chromatin-remodeling complex ATPase chain Iswi n=1 Tax=Lachnellula suecica TaxID=602035 RepID=A0A8T9CF56_9HELO|nr:Chromatin-remodeling complex ATPase chain Iswi [Lachnellula suecica]
MDLKEKDLPSSGPATPNAMASSPSQSQPQPPFSNLSSFTTIDLSNDEGDKQQTNNTQAAQNDDEVIEYTPSPRQLRERKANMSIKAQENAEVTRQRPRTEPRRRHRAKSTPNSTPKVSKRVEIRKEISTNTAALRTAFFLEKKDLLLPLLPAANHVRKLIEKHSRLSQQELAKLPKITPYRELESQRAGLSGILGDEMGLGKTLQTISLIQYLKEHDPKSGSGSSQRPFLVVCPLSVLSSWMTELKKWAPDLNAVRFHGPEKERNQLKRLVMGDVDKFGNPTAKAAAKQRAQRSHKSITIDTDSENEEAEGVDVVVTTYDSYKAEQSWFKRALVWRYIVLDEGHMVKNHESGISKSLQGLQAEYRLLLTGTPLQNNLSELWALFHWLYPEVFNDNTLELFENSFNLTKGQYSNAVVVDSRRLLELIMLRRMKDSPGVNLNLPPKTEVLLFVPLSPTQRMWYQRIITRSDEGLLDEIFKGSKQDTFKDEDEVEKTRALEVIADESNFGTEEFVQAQAILAASVETQQVAQSGSKTDYQRLMNLLMQLRKVCNHPYQIPNAVDEDSYETGAHMIHASGKFMVLEKLLLELVVKQKKKILIFSGFTQTLDLVDELLLLRGGDGSEYRSCRIDGQIPRAKRNLGIRLFNKTDSNYRVMLISTRAGGLGINLASASDVVLMDQDWNPQITLQAEARAHRIGQKNPVTVYKLISSGTVEEQMMGRIQKKLYLSVKVTEAMQDIHTKFGSGKKSKRGRPSGVEQDEDLPQLSTNQLMGMVRRGAATLARPQIDVDEMLDWDWDMTLSKCKDKPIDVEVKKDIVTDATVDDDEERRWLTEQEHVTSTLFEGKHLNRGSKSYTDNTAAEYALIDRAERRKGKNTTVMVNGYAISKESMGCKDWEAVPTMAGKNPALAEPKRAKRKAVQPQSHCQVCLDGGDLVCCQRCPRAYHLACLDKGFKTKAVGYQFVCPQHECFDCLQNTSNAGGMLYRCRWCERAYCEDHLEFDDTNLIDNNLPEFELLDYPAMDNAFYVECPTCLANFGIAPQNQKLCYDMAEDVRVAHEQRFKSPDTPASPMTEATTAETTALNTPSLANSENGYRLNDQGSFKTERNGSFKYEYGFAPSAVDHQKGHQTGFASKTAQPNQRPSSTFALQPSKPGPPSQFAGYQHPDNRYGPVSSNHAAYAFETGNRLNPEPKRSSLPTNNTSNYFPSANSRPNVTGSSPLTNGKKTSNVIVTDDSDDDGAVEFVPGKKRKLSSASEALAASKRVFS